VRYCLDLSHHAWARARDPAAAARATLRLARDADAAGIDAIWVTEDADGWDAFALLAAIAGVTRRARLGSGVTNPYARHPNLIAASVATLDRLSGGRAILGLGRGQPEWYGRGLGLAVGSPPRVLEETIDLLEQWWSPTHRADGGAGAHFPVHDWERTIHPVQARPPIYLAAAGPRALALAGRRADGVIFNALTSNEFLAEAIRCVKREAAAAGRELDALAFVLRTAATVTDDAGPVLERQKNLLALINCLPGMDRLIQSDGFDVPAIVAAVQTRMGMAEGLVAGGFPELRRRGDLRAARAAIPPELITRLAIAGSPAEVGERLRQIEALGVTHVSVAPPATGGKAAFVRLLKELRQAVISVAGFSD
jgi:alkanesulfonate monooxygenase SsuD/methylene tetrahydromethanopterin reductase-like flavin-dependent oxidoreductase (luciferase family)